MRVILNGCHLCSVCVTAACSDCSDGTSPLWRAAHHDRLTVLQLLIAAKADLDIPNKNTGWTALVPLMPHCPVPSHIQCTGTTTCVPLIVDCSLPLIWWLTQLLTPLLAVSCMVAHTIAHCLLYGACSVQLQTSTIEPS